MESKRPPELQSILALDPDAIDRVGKALFEPHSMMLRKIETIQILDPSTCRLNIRVDLDIRLNEKEGSRGPYPATADPDELVLGVGLISKQAERPLHVRDLSSNCQSRHVNGSLPTSNQRRMNRDSCHLPKSTSRCWTFVGTWGCSCQVG
jgi:hypothetical protein